jgi:hypothetical protein
VDFGFVVAVLVCALACVVDAADDVVATAVDDTGVVTADAEADFAATCAAVPLEQAPAAASTGMVNSMPAARKRR